jgi:hypothetical protein
MKKGLSKEQQQYELQEVKGCSVKARGYVCASYTTARSMSAAVRTWDADEGK